jgi:hypothetical protein
MRSAHQKFSPLESFKEYELPGVYEKLVRKGPELFVNFMPEVDLRDLFERYKFANSIELCDGMAEDEAVTTFVNGFREKMVDDGVSFIVEGLQVYADPTLFKDGRRGFYGWMTVAVPAKSDEATQNKEVD